MLSVMETLNVTFSNSATLKYHTAYLKVMEAFKTNVSFLQINTRIGVNTMQAVDAAIADLYVRTETLAAGVVMSDQESLAAKMMERILKKDLAASVLVVYDFENLSSEKKEIFMEKLQGAKARLVVFVSLMN